MKRVGQAALQRLNAARDRLQARWSEGVTLLAAPNPDWPAVEAKEAELSAAQKEYQDIFYKVWIERARILNAGTAPRGVRRTGLAGGIGNVLKLETAGAKSQVKLDSNGDEGRFPAGVRPMVASVRIVRWGRRFRLPNCVRHN